jgi:outer membrane lipoprotein carrier protein
MTPYLFSLMMWLTMTPASALVPPAPKARLPRGPDVVFVSPGVGGAAGAPATAAPAPVPVTAAPVLSPADEIVAKVQAVYEKTLAFKAAFTQIYSHKVYKRDMKSTGIVYFKKPGLMRMEYTTPEKKIFIADGKFFWMYEPAEDSAIKAPLDDSTLPTSITFLMGKGDLRTEFEAKLLADHPLGAKGALVLELTPRGSTAHYKKLQLVVNPTTWFVEETLVFDPTGNVNHIVFGKPDLDGGLDPKLFVFDVPPGVKVVEAK